MTQQVNNMISPKWLIILNILCAYLPFASLHWWSICSRILIWQVGSWLQHARPGTVHTWCTLGCGVGPGAVAVSLRCFSSRGTLGPRPVTKAEFPALQGRLLTPGPSGKSPAINFFIDYALGAVSKKDFLLCLCLDLWKTQIHCFVYEYLIAQVPFVEKIMLFNERTPL